MEYTVKRSSRRSVSMEVGAGGRIIVRAPMTMSPDEIESFVLKHRKWAEKHIRMVMEREQKHPPATDENKKNMARQVAEIIKPRVEYYAALMGVHPNGIKITGADKRFGSCSSKNSLCFSYRLLEFSPRAIDYVVVHELAHIRHKNHGPAFYAEIAKVMPDYKLREQELKR